MTSVLVTGSKYEFIPPHESLTALIAVCASPILTAFFFMQHETRNKWQRDA